jgi:TolB-like protein
MHATGALQDRSSGIDSKRMSKKYGRHSGSNEKFLRILAKPYRLTYPSCRYGCGFDTIAARKFVQDRTIAMLNDGRAFDRETTTTAGSSNISSERALGIAYIWRFAPCWHQRTRRIVTGIAGLAAVGTVLGGLTGYWTTYKALNDWISRRQVVMPAPRLSIAVLPFENLSGDPAQDYFGDAVVENLTTDLSVNIPALVVITGGSALTDRNQRIDPKRIGQELNVRYLLLGSVLRSADQLRINARLVDAENGEQLWADRFDGSAADLLKLQDQVTSRISSSLQFTLPIAWMRKTQMTTTTLLSM